MHQVKSAASPYLYEIKLNSEYQLTHRDVATFQKKVERGVAVYGYTPSILISTASSYSYWESLTLLLKTMDTGKLAICTDDKIDSIIDDLSALFLAIEIRIFAKSGVGKAKAWVIE